jgi:hypothetical protein
MRVDRGWRIEEAETQRTQRSQRGREREIKKDKSKGREVLERRGESMRWARIEFTGGGWRAS